MASSEGSAESPDNGFTEGFEGYAALQANGDCCAYWDTLGSVWTIAFGLTGNGITKGTRWTRAQSEQNFSVRWNQTKQQVLSASPCLSNSPNKLIAVTDFAYNEGIHNYIASTLRRKINTGDTAGAVQEFSKWNLAGGKVVKGLVIRRAAEATLFQQASVSENASSNSGDVDVPASPAVGWLNGLIGWLSRVRDAIAKSNQHLDS